VNSLSRLLDAGVQSGTSRKSRRITGARRRRDATNDRWIRGSSSLTDGSDSGII